MSESQDPPQIGRTPEVSDQEIIEAGHALIENDRRVTGFALRRAVGNRGDAKRLLRVWEAHQKANELEEAESVQELPIELAERLEQVISGVTEQLKAAALAMNTTAVNIAERRVTATVKLAREQQKKAEAEMRDASATIEDLEVQANERDLLLKAAQEENASLKAKLQDLTQGKIAMTQERAVMVEQIQSLQVQLDTVRKEAGDHQTTSERLAALLDEMKTDKTELKDELANARKRIDEGHQVCSQLRDELVREKAENDKFQEKIAAFSKKINTLESKQSGTEVEIRDLIREKGVMAGQVQAKDQHTKQLEEKLSHALAKLAKLEQ